MPETNTIPIHLAAPFKVMGLAVTTCGQPLDSVACYTDDRATYQRFTIPQFEACLRCWRESGITVLPSDSILEAESVDELQQLYIRAYRRRDELLSRPIPFRLAETCDYARQVGRTFAHSFDLENRICVLCGAAA